MTNEIILVLTAVFLYLSVLLWYKFFGSTGLMCFTVLATIVANIEVLILVNAFGMEMTLGNILFSCTFLVTDILSEIEGKEKAKQAVKIGVATSILFLIISQSWLFYTPSVHDHMLPNIRNIFSMTPRLILTSVIVYALVQVIDVWLYHKWWQFTENKFNDKRKFLWLRNNGSTIISQLLNSILFTYLAFYGIYDNSTLISITLTSYSIFFVISLLDTPVIYMARRMHEKGVAK